MYCKNCGAKLKTTETKCPYCGTLQLLGAESEYMKKLEDILEDTEDLEDLPSEEYSRQLKSHGKFALKTALIVVGICLGLFLFLQGGLYIYHYVNTRQMEEYSQEAKVFKEKYFSSLNEIYEAGNDQATYEYLLELYEKDVSHALSQWPHDSYFFYYGFYWDIMKLQQHLSENTAAETEWSSAFYSALTLTQEEIWESDRTAMSREELDKIEGFQKEAETFLTDTMHLSLQKQKQVYQECCRDGFLDFKQCEKYLSKMKKQWED